MTTFIYYPLYYICGFIMPRYSKEDEEIIRKGYSDPNIIIKEIAEQLNRNDPSLIAIKAKKMGLKKVMRHHSPDGYICSTCGKKLIKDINWVPSHHNGKYKRYTCASCVRSRNYFNSQRKVLRERVVNLLGGHCLRCGFNDKRALQIDHIHGGGRKDIKSFGGQEGYYKHLLSLSDKKLKEKYQLLCANCNIIKKYEKGEFAKPRYK